MASLNKVFLIGNLTRDPDLRYTPGGAAVCELGLAVNRRFTTAGKEEREETCFVDIVVWGKQAESVGRYTRKGGPIFIEGRLQLDQWDDRETGKKRSKMRVVAERVQFLDGPGRGAAATTFEEDDAGGEYAPPPPRQIPPRQAPPRAAAPPPRQAAPPPSSLPPAVDDFPPDAEPEDNIPF